MVQTWSNWKGFPDAQSGEHVEAPIGPGVYEVRHTMTGRVVAFGHSANVANSLADLKLNGGISAFSWLFRKPPLVSHVADLEYRTCAATSRAGQLASAAGELWRSAQEVKPGSAPTQFEVATTEGSLFVVRDDETYIAATTGGNPTVGLVFYDLKSTLRNLKKKEAESEPPAQEETTPKPATKPRKTTTASGTKKKTAAQPSAK